MAFEYRELGEDSHKPAEGISGWTCRPPGLRMRLPRRVGELLRDSGSSSNLAHYRKAQPVSGACPCRLDDAQRSTGHVRLHARAIDVSAVETRKAHVVQTFCAFEQLGVSRNSRRR